MSISISDEATRSVTLERIDAVLAVKPKSLLRTKELGEEHDFNPALEFFEATHKIYSELRECDLSILLTEDLNKIVGKADGVIRVYERIKSWSPSKPLPEWGPEPKLQRDRLVEEVKAAYKQSYEYFRELIPYIRPQVSQEQLKQLVATAKDTMKLIEDQHVRANKAAEDTQKTLEKAQQAAGETAAASYASFFEAQAKEHWRGAWGWLVMVVLTLGITIAVALSNIETFGRLTQFFSEGEYSDAAYVIFSKLIVLGTLYFSVVWTSKMYRASKHNYVVNKHRENALHTFGAFVKAAKDDVQTQHAVLLQATQSIFSHQQSGYITNEPDPSPSSSQILEIFRQVNHK